MDPRLDDTETSLRDAARAAADELIEPRAADIDADRRLPEGLFGDLGARFLLSAGIPEAGEGGSRLLELCLVVEEVGRASASAGAVLVGHLVVAQALAAAGSPVAPDLASGRRLAAFAVDQATSPLVEPGTVVVGAEGGRLQGEIGAVTGAAVAEVLLVPARDSGTIGLYVVGADADGVEIGEEGPWLGLNGSGTASVRLEGAAGELLERPGLEELVDVMRLGYAALAVGVSQGALDRALRLARDDEALAGSQSVQWMLADCATETEAGRLLTWYAATEGGAELTENAAMARLIACEAAVASSRRAVQVYGGRGALRAHGVERLYRDAKVLEVHGGANEAQRRAVVRRLMPDLAG